MSHILQLATTEKGGGQFNYFAAHKKSKVRFSLGVANFITGPLLCKRIRNGATSITEWLRDLHQICSSSKIVRSVHFI